MMQRFLRLSIRRKVTVIAIVLLAGSGMVLGAARLGKRSPTVPTIEVKRGEFLDSTDFRGEVKALKSVTISAPADAGDLRIVKLCPDGTAVKPGDLVVEFDKTKTEQDLAQYRSSLKSAEAEIEQARAQARLSAEEDKTAVLKAGYEVEKAKLDAGKQEIVSRIEGEEAKLKVADAEQNLREAETKRKSDKSLHQATIEVKNRPARGQVRRGSRRNAPQQMTLHAPSARTISLPQHWTGSSMASYRTGDRAWPGAAIAELPDATTLRISARVDETERGRLALAKQPATVQLDAIADRQFTGQTGADRSHREPGLSGGWPLYSHNFVLENRISTKADPRLKRGRSGQITVIVDRVPNAISIPAQALFEKSGQDASLRLWRGRSLKSAPSKSKGEAATRSWSSRANQDRRASGAQRTLRRRSRGSRMI